MSCYGRRTWFKLTYHFINYFVCCTENFSNKCAALFMIINYTMYNQ